MTFKHETGTIFPDHYSHTSTGVMYVALSLDQLPNFSDIKKLFFAFQNFHTDLHKERKYWEKYYWKYHQFVKIF